MITSKETAYLVRNIYSDREMRGIYARFRSQFVQVARNEYGLTEQEPLSYEDPKGPTMRQYSGIVYSSKLLVDADVAIRDAINQGLITEENVSEHVRGLLGIAASLSKPGEGK